MSELVNNSYNLKPCPFCGSKTLKKCGYEDSEIRMLYIICEHCGATGPAKQTRNPRVKDENNPAITAWNRRAE